MGRIYFLPFALLTAFAANAEASTLVFHHPHSGAQVAVGADRNEEDPGKFQLHECSAKSGKQLPKFVHMRELLKSDEAICKPVTSRPIKYDRTSQAADQNYRAWEHAIGTIPFDQNPVIDKIATEIESGMKMGAFPSVDGDPDYILVKLRVGNTENELRLNRNFPVKASLHGYLSYITWLGAPHPQLGGMRPIDALPTEYLAAVDRVAVEYTSVYPDFIMRAGRYADAAKWVDSQKRNLEDCQALVNEYRAMLNTHRLAFNSPELAGEDEVRVFLERIKSAHEKADEEYVRDRVETDGHGCYRNLLAIEKKMAETVDADVAFLKLVPQTEGLADYHRDFYDSVKRRVNTYVVPSK